MYSGHEAACLKCHKPLDDTRQEVQKMRDLCAKLETNCSMLEFTTNSLAVKGLVDASSKILEELTEMCYSESMKLQQNIFKYAEALSTMLKSSNESGSDECGLVPTIIKLADEYDAISQRQQKRKLATESNSKVSSSKLDTEKVQLLFWINILKGFFFDKKVTTLQVQGVLSRSMRRLLVVLKGILSSEDDPQPTTIELVKTTEQNLEEFLKMIANNSESSV